jgi:glucans biosynthesis protein
VFKEERMKTMFRSVARHRVLLAGFAFGVLLVSTPARSAQTIGKAQVFDYAWLKGQARALAEQDYVDHEGEMPEQLKSLSWDDYQQLRYDKKHALWRDTDALFRGELFHLGLYFQTPITVYQLEDGQAEELAYDRDLFDYGESGVKGRKLPKDLGFAGFRYQFHSDWQRDVVAFLGASYFRAVGAEMQYGMSARGLAVDTAVPEGEEFPLFTHFWLETPKPGSDTATVYALLDSPSVTGAYRFDITPGETLTMTVDAAIYPRQSIQRLGVAPLTSMYMIGENSRRTHWDWRPEIHDSDGLLMHTGGGEWIWRPLVNPANLRFNAYADENPKGFGLLQRDQDFDHYQDDGVFYDRRPGVWVKPIHDWGPGSIQLVEIPTLDETFDNIVAFWNPAKPVEAGQELLFSYKLHWGTQRILPSNQAQVVNTFTGLGGVVGQRREYFSQRFVVDFAGGLFPMLGGETTVEPVITTSAGRVEITSARPQHAIDGYRAMFDVVPPDGSSEPINLKVYLAIDGRPVTETWIYQWTPPPADQRDLRNPGHL